MLILADRRLQRTNPLLSRFLLLRLWQRRFAPLTSRCCLVVKLPSKFASIRWRGSNFAVATGFGDVSWPADMAQEQAQGQCYARELYAGCADSPLVHCTWCWRPMHEACGGELHGKRACWICLPMQGVEHGIDGLLHHHAHARYEDRCASLYCPGSLVRGGSHRCEVCHDAVHVNCGVPHAEKGQMYRTCHQCAFGKPSHCPFCKQQLQQQWDAARAHIHTCWQRHHALRGRCKLCAPPSGGDGTGGASEQATRAGSSTGSDDGGGGDSSGGATGGATGGGTSSVLAHHRIR